MAFYYQIEYEPSKKKKTKTHLAIKKSTFVTFYILNIASVVVYMFSLFDMRLYL